MTERPTSARFPGRPDLDDLATGRPGTYEISASDLATLILGYDPAERFDGEGPVREPGAGVCDPDTGKVRVLDDKCGTCVFRPHNLMRLRPGRLRSMVQEAVDNGTWITCHTTLPYHPDHPGWSAVCRGFFDAHRHQSQMLRIAVRLDRIVEVSLPAPSPLGAHDDADHP